MADLTRYVCQVHGCGFASEAVLSWRLGKGVRIPYSDGIVGQRDGMHVQMQLCKRHRIEAIDTPPLPYKAQQTPWGAKPDKYGLTVTEAGDLLVPGVKAS